MRKGVGAARLRGDDDLDRRFVGFQRRRGQAGVAAVVVRCIGLGGDLRRMREFLRGGVKRRLLGRCLGRLAWRAADATDRFVLVDGR